MANAYERPPPFSLSCLRFRFPSLPFCTFTQIMEIMAHLQNIPLPTESYTLKYVDLGSVILRD